MKEIKPCKCDTTSALAAQDIKKLIVAVQEHRNHRCPNYNTAIRWLIAHTVPVSV